MALQDNAPTTRTGLDDLDAAAEFEAGLAELLPFLRIFAQSLTRHREPAEDLAQEALAKAWRFRKSFVPGSNLKAWLFTILRNEFYSQQRRAWRQIPWDDGLVKAQSSPRDEQQWALELSVTASAIDDLPPGQREALILVGVGGFSYDEAALLSRSAVGTMKSRVARARRLLKRNCDDPTLPSKKSRPANGNAMSDILAQLSAVRQRCASQAHS